MTAPRELSKIIKIARGETLAGKQWAKLSDHDRDMVELGVRRLVSLGYRILPALEATPPAPVVTHRAGDIRLEDLFRAAEAEAFKAMRKFPQPNYVISKVAEEAGEVVKAAIHCAEGREKPEHVVAEISQAFAMLIRLYLEGDQVHGLPPLAPAQQSGPTAQEHPANG